MVFRDCEGEEIEESNKEQDKELEDKSMLSSEMLEEREVDRIRCLKVLNEHCFVRYHLE